MSIADVIAVMNNGHLEDVGPPSRVYLKPRTLFAATFMGESNMFEGTVTGRAGESIEVDTAFGRFNINGSAEPGARVNLSIRPEQIIVADGDIRDQVPLGILKVEEVSFFGTHHRCLGRHVKSNLPMIIRLPQHQAVGIGEDLNLSVQPEDIVLLMQ